MKIILDFKLEDTGLLAIPQGLALKHWCSPKYPTIVHGMGTDAESALDDLLQNLQENDYDVEGLAARIRMVWNPSTEEGNGATTFYHLYLRIEE